MQIIHPLACFKKILKTHFVEVKELSAEAKIRDAGLKMWEQLRSLGMSSEKALSCVMDSFGHQERYWYRWRCRFRERGRPGLEKYSRRPHKVRKRCWPEDILLRITAIRNHEDTCRWGAAKLYHQLLKEQRQPPSIATIGRMLRHLKDQKKIVFFQRCNKRGSNQCVHGQRYKKNKHGHLSRIQLDVDHYLEDGQRLYVFDAIHINSRYLFSHCYSSASSGAARKFLQYIMDRLPEGMIIDALQVDGGGEFKGEFEQAVKDMNMLLLVNHPRTPKQNAYVERVHRTVDEEFRQVTSMPFTVAGMNEGLKEYVELYNHHRPHTSLAYKTPCEWLAEHATKDPPRVA